MENEGKKRKLRIFKDIFGFASILCFQLSLLGSLPKIISGFLVLSDTVPAVGFFSMFFLLVGLIFAVLYFKLRSHLKEFDQELKRLTKRK